MENIFLLSVITIVLLLFIRNILNERDNATKEIDNKTEDKDNE